MLQHYKQLIFHGQSKGSNSLWHHSPQESHLHPAEALCNLNTSRQSAEQLDVQAMDVSDEDERPQSAEEPHVEASPSGVTRSRPSSRSKVKAPRKGKSTLPPPIGGDHIGGNGAFWFGSRG